MTNDNRLNPDERDAGALTAAAERLHGSKAVDKVIADMPARDANDTADARDIGRDMSPGAKARALAAMTSRRKR